ncbi:MAG: hypothetical protein WB729_04320 [Candidatus Sulfotelmatobacter sp.]
MVASSGSCTRLLAAHTLGSSRITVDNTSLVLLVLVLLSPFVAAIKKIKIGDFEAEIEPDEVKRIAREAEESLPERLPSKTHPPEMNATASAIRSLAETDPPIALAKLRIEIETSLRQLQRRVRGGLEKGRPAPLISVIRELTAAEALSPQLGATLRDVIAICNRAIHGEDIRGVDAEKIVNVGIDLLSAIRQETREFVTTHPVESTVISPSERDGLLGAKYRLTTVVPLSANPERRVYVVTQVELDEFFDGYSEFAEFVIAIERIG